MKWCLLLILLSFWGVLISQQSNPFDIPKGRSDASDVSRMEQREPEIGSSTALVADTVVQRESPVADTSDLPLSNQRYNPFDITINGRTQVGSATDDAKEDSGFRSPIIRDQATEASSDDISLIVLIFVLAMMVILSLAVSLDRKRCSDVFRSLINSNSLKTLYRETNAWTNGQTVILYLSFFLIVPFLIWVLSIKYYGSGVVHLWWIGLALVMCYLIRHFITWLIAVIYPLGVEVGQFNYSIMLHNIVLAIILLPLLLAIEFVTSLEIKTYVFIAFGLFLLVYFFRQAKGVMSLLSMRGFNPLYFFIYLCAVEIAPIMLFYKIISGAL